MTLLAMPSLMGELLRASTQDTDQDSGFPKLFLTEKPLESEDLMPTDSRQYRLGK